MQQQLAQSVDGLLRIVPYLSLWSFVLIYLQQELTRSWMKPTSQVYKLTRSEQHSPLPFLTMYFSHSLCTSLILCGIHTNTSSHLVSRTCSNMMYASAYQSSSSHQITPVFALRGTCGLTQCRKGDLRHIIPFHSATYLLINIASIESLSGVLGEENEATLPEDSVILDEWGVIQGISRAERVDLMPGAAAAGEGRSSQPQSLSKA